MSQQQNREMNIRPAEPRDIDSIVAIYNAGIRSGRGTFETQPRAQADIQAWLETEQCYPVLVVEHANSCVGFARLSSYRPRECYAGIAEFSIYLDESVRGQGVGTQLLAKLLEQAKEVGFYKVLSRVFTFNHASLSLCERLGFRQVGTYERHGKLNGQWLDVVIVEYVIEENCQDLGGDNVV